MSARIPKLVFLRFQNFKLFQDFPYYAGYPTPGTKPLVRIWLLNAAEIPWAFSRLCLCLFEYWWCDEQRSSRFLESLTFNFSQGSQWWWIQTFIAQNKGAGGSPRSATGSMLPEPPTLNPINTLKPSPKTIQFPFIKESRQCQLWLGAEAITLSRWKASVSSMGFNLCLLKLVQCYNCLNWLEIDIFFCYVFSECNNFTF